MGVVVGISLLGVGSFGIEVVVGGIVEAEEDSMAVNLESCIYFKSI